MAKTKTSSEVKDRWNRKTYDEIKVRVEKGYKEEIKAHSEALGVSVNAFINRAICEAIERDSAAPAASCEAIEGKG